eukprot:9457471-Pyramimonas_sp.AAC.1
MAGRVELPQRDLQGVRQCRFLTCLPTQLGPRPTPEGPADREREPGSGWAVKLARRAQEGQC